MELGMPLSEPIIESHGSAHGNEVNEDVPGYVIEINAFQFRDA